MNILFICTGNTCRSPMATAILAHKNIENIEVRSAGIYAANGAPMSTYAQMVLDEHNISHAHQSASVMADDLSWADLVLTMTTSHREAIAQQYPQAIEKTFTLKEYTTTAVSRDVLDPFGGNKEIYEATFHELQQLIDKLIKLIEEEK